MTAYGSWEINLNADGGPNPGGYISAASVQPAFFNFFDGTQTKTVRNLALNGATPTLIGSPTYTPGVSGTSPGYASFTSGSTTGTTNTGTGINTNVNDPLATPTTGGAITVFVVARSEAAIPTSGFTGAVCLFGDNVTVGNYTAFAIMGNSGGNVGIQFNPSFQTSGTKFLVLTQAQMQAWGLYVFQYQVGGGTSAVNFEALTVGTSSTYSGTDAVPSKTVGPISFGTSLQSQFQQLSGIGDFFCAGVWLSYLSSTDIAAVAAQIRNRATQYEITV